MPDLGAHLLTPGSAKAVVPIVNVTLGGLLVVLFASALRWPGIALHLYAMMLLALGLLGSLNWVAAQLPEKAD